MRLRWYLKVLTLMKMDEKYRIVDICLVLNLIETCTKEILRTFSKRRLSKRVEIECINEVVRLNSSCFLYFEI